LFDTRFRTAVDKVAGPAGRALRRTGLSPDHLTALGILLSVPAAWAIATGHLVWGYSLLIASALPDTFDGSLAKASGRSSRRGAFFDSVGDRVSDTVVLVGFAWYAQDRFGHHAALVPLAVLGVSQLVSYIRAKGDVLGIEAKGGLMERGERIFVLCFALKFEADMLWLLWLIFALSLVTAVQRFVKVWRQAGKPPAPLPVEPTAVVLRWRAWREERSSREAWWAWAPRGPASGAFSGRSRRPGGRTASSPWHQRRIERRERFADGRRFSKGERLAKDERLARDQGAAGSGGHSGAGVPGAAEQRRSGRLEGSKGSRARRLGGSDQD
jgi:CDP-diacylglycerol--glycerol-3-phosphate 3-phosphatidyltransferase